MQLNQPCFNAFNFDEWAALAKEDPDAFELRRTQCLREAITQAPNHAKRRLEGLQFQIDMIRRQAKHPMGACIRINSMMFDFFLDELPSAIALFTYNKREGTDQMQPAGKVISFNTTLFRHNKPQERPCSE